MDLYQYFKSYQNYFWQWEEDTEVIAIPYESTIAYKRLVFEILNGLSPQGIPPFGSFLLAMIATNPNGSQSIDTVFQMIKKEFNRGDDQTLSDAIAFLHLLSVTPKAYKEGKKRVMLFQAIFEKCHNMVSAKNALRIMDECRSENYSVEQLSAKAPFTYSAFYNDFRTISLLAGKFHSVDEILAKVASLPDIPDDFMPPEAPVKEAGTSADLIDQLIENSKTYRVGSLVKRIWSGLQIPVHSSLPSQQPLGGVSDLSNKGDFDKLLISEFANEDLVFLSRLANNEALYINREVPPANNPLQRIILIDVSLKNWGTPKTVAFAVMLAIARHPKTDIGCSAFAIGNKCYPIRVDSADSILDGLMILEGSLDASKGLEAFFKEHAPKGSQEVFVITESSTRHQAEMLKAMSAYHRQIHYWIYTDAMGNIDVYKKQQESKRHLQHIQLPLAELWKKEKPVQTPRAESISLLNCPILFRNSYSSNQVLKSPDGEIYQITKEKRVLKRYDKSADVFEKGWELIYENLPVFSQLNEIGMNVEGHPVLLIFNPQNRDLWLINLHTGEQLRSHFSVWKPSVLPGFFFYENYFYFKSQFEFWQIGMDGTTERYFPKNPEAFTKMMQERMDAAISVDHGLSILKNIHEIFINDMGYLVFNIHELSLKNGGYFKIDKTNRLEKIIAAYRIHDTEFEFRDGSRIQINREGMLVFKSSHQEIPVFYIPSLIDTALGVGSETHISGNSYYHKYPKETGPKQTILGPADFYKRYIDTFIRHIQLNETKP